MHAKLAFTATLAFALAGCGTMGGGLSNNSTVYSSNQPVVERTNYAMDINLNGYSGIAMSERTRLSEWFDALELGFGDRITVDFGDAGPNSSVTRDVTDLAQLHGMIVGDTAPLTPGNIVPGTARIVVTRSSASVPNCPNWSKTTDSNYNSGNHPNYGCAVNGNLAAMVADPEDLVRGRESTLRKDTGAGRPKLPTDNNGGN
jgi:pilus assembly protein CpaD